jgi:Xaa-Pro aminopeptidase
VGQENKIIKREAELAVIERALKVSKKSLREAVKEVEGFLMSDNDKKEAVIKMKLKVRIGEM